MGVVDEIQADRIKESQKPLSVDLDVTARLAAMIESSEHIRDYAMWLEDRKNNLMIRLENGVLQKSDVADPNPAEIYLSHSLPHRPEAWSVAADAIAKNGVRLPRHYVYLGDDAENVIYLAEMARYHDVPLIRARAGDVVDYILIQQQLPQWLSEREELKLKLSDLETNFDGKIAEHLVGIFGNYGPAEIGEEYRRSLRAARNRLRKEYRNNELRSMMKGLGVMDRIDRRNVITSVNELLEKALEGSSHRRVNLGDLLQGDEGRKLFEQAQAEFNLHREARQKNIRPGFLYELYGIKPGALEQLRRRMPRLVLGACKPYMAATVEAAKKQAADEIRRKYNISATDFSYLISGNINDVVQQYKDAISSGLKNDITNLRSRLARNERIVQNGQEYLAR